jgi:gamma-glutamylcyclotransferase (GGCT)/AIG2-like uncharacterized protein YtfP
MTPGAAGDLIFVYGTLRSDMPARGRLVAVRSASGLLADNGERLGRATMGGRLYDVGAYPAFVSSTDGPRVQGELWRIFDLAAVFPYLNAYEGSAYRLIDARAALETGEEHVARVYEWSLDVGALQPIPSGDYLQWLAAD